MVLDRSRCANYCCEIKVRYNFRFSQGSTLRENARYLIYFNSEHCLEQLSIHYRKIYLTVYGLTYWLRLTRNCYL